MQDIYGGYKGGVYILYHPGSDMTYVGSTNDFTRRLRRHISDLNCNRHPNTYLQRSCNKSPDLEISLVYTETREEAFDLEQSILDEYIDSGLLYNHARDSRYCSKGMPMSEETKKKISETNKGNQNWLGKTHSEETKAKMSAWQIGRKFSDETKAKMRAAKLGKKQSPEHIEKVRQTVIGRPMAEKASQALDASRRERMKAVEVDGVVFESVAAASRHFSIDTSTAFNRLNKSTKFPNWKYVD